VDKSPDEVCGLIEELAAGRQHWQSRDQDHYFLRKNRKEVYRVYQHYCPTKITTDYRKEGRYPNAN